MKPKSKILIIAGSDSSGGAGIQADIKTVTALGGFATTAITALTAQNTMGVSSIIEVPINFLLEQIKVVADHYSYRYLKKRPQEHHNHYPGTFECLRK